MLEYSDLLFDGPKDAGVIYLLAHGAGGPMDSEFMTDFAHNLGERGTRVCRFEFDYMRRRRTEGTRGGPDRPPKLTACWMRAIDLVRDREKSNRVAIGGKSMGGRIASMIADQAGVDSLVCLGYPFHPPGKPEKLRTEHLEDLATRTLIIQGERDPFGRPDEVDTYSLSDAISIHWLADGDHSFKPRKKSGVTLEENIREAVDQTARFIMRSS